MDDIVSLAATIRGYLTDEKHTGFIENAVLF